MIVKARCREKYRLTTLAQHMVSTQLLRLQLAIMLIKYRKQVQAFLSPSCNQIWINSTNFAANLDLSKRIAPRKILKCQLYPWPLRWSMRILTVCQLWMHRLTYRTTLRNLQLPVTSSLSLCRSAIASFLTSLSPLCSSSTHWTSIWDSWRS